GCINCCKVL
nr:Chain M, Transforming protein RhoB [synthetic construct]1TNU_N Chain N, Transforming protein RhoB [synthetic construct]1TNU_O Chain O, Transforming protein RhoB [synthetic construct]1TNU_P Chain P, Transforming protein RhoB [synthetic construct]1TNU_Q Chain Q, Transforming protein RhoB [synthetic construct]1TNU_R Chain R, Transforming protein RhoB [synthetic construct]